MNADSAPQGDEKNTDDPARQLAAAHEQIARMSRDLDELQIEQKLAHRLAAAGAVDLETAVLVAKARLAAGASAPPNTDGERQRPPGAEIDGCVAQLRKEKAYLFGGPPETAAPRRTAPARDRATAGPTALEQAAQKAARTGSRADLQHYLKLRRNLL
jgi:hypothetical protein